ncbi:MAG: amino acid adenylation domain-containing protein [Vitreoscilla sp.]|nr:amino acid adenylation domain-containing protein [Vitreoscilla sp.]
MNSAVIDTTEFDPFASGEVARVFPTSEAQREVWLADQLSAQASLAFNESITLRLNGALDAHALTGALQRLVARHDALRCTFGPDGTEQFVAAQVLVDLPVFDLRAMAPADSRQAMDRAAAQAVEKRFDLARGPLFRAALYRLADDEHALLLTAHHIVCDGWSWGVISHDLGALYTELLGMAPEPDPAPSYGDYVEWEAREAASPAMRDHERYWTAQFSGSLPVLDLPADRPRPALRGFQSLRIDHVLDEALVASVRKAGAKAGASLFATLFAGFGALLARLTAQDDLVIGVPSAGQAASGLTGLVGHCVNLLPVRAAVNAEQDFASLVGHCGGRVLDAFDHQTLTYGALLQQLQVERDPRRLPLVSVMFNLDQAVKGLDEAYPGLQVGLSANPRHYENFELFVNAVPVGGALRLECQYNTGLFDDATLRRWLACFEALLRAAVATPAVPLGRLDALPESAMQELRALQVPATPLSATDLMHSAFLRQCGLTPELPAVTDGGAALRYSELDERSNRLAQAMRARGIQRGGRVGLCLARNADMVVALLGVLKAGATYIPLDPGFPADRLAYYAEDARLDLLVLDAPALATAPTAWCADAGQRLLRLDDVATWLQHPAAPLASGPGDAQPEDAAYIIYTSGSTGKPKGVCVPHRSVVNFLASMRREPGLAQGDCLAAVTTLSFDIAVLEWMLPLTVGAQVLVVPREVVMDGERLRQLMHTHRANAMQGTPSLWRLLLDTPWQGGPGFKALVGGEAFPLDVANQLLERAGEVWNLYGPTETTIWSTVWRVDAQWLSAHGMSIGRPIANTSVWILDEAGRPVPVGVSGEVYIGGSGVALGYLDRPELNAERFLPDPFQPGGLIYRTGDRGRWHNSGLLEHQGRLDFQVKVRGYRIELGEIEAACTEVPGVAQCVVLAREDHAADVRLVAYLVLAPGGTFDEAALRAHLRSKLPDYMLPQHLMVLPAMPLLPNGKVDRKALPAPEREPARDSADRVPPRSETEERVLAAMEAVLNLPGMGVTDDFFALGGHSLLAARLTSRLNREFEINLPLSTLFEAPTAERLALAVTAMQSSSVPRREPLVASAGRRSAPLTPMQERIRFVQEMHPGRVLYNTPSGHRLTGPMDLGKFEEALREVIRRQPALRTQIALGDDGQTPVQQVLDSVPFALPLEDLSGVPADLREAELLARMQRVVDQPMDIHQAPLFRAVMYRLAAQEHALLFMPHHIVWDGWSFDLFYEEVSALYGALQDGRPSPLPALSVSYGDYAEWYLKWLNGEEAAQQLAYWKQRFAKAPVPRAPWTDHPRRAGMTGEGATEWVRIDHGLTERLREIARGADATLNMLTYAVYAAMMVSVIDSPSIVVAIPVRGRLMAEVEPVMGFFNNLLPLPVTADTAQGCMQFLKDVRRDLLEALGRQDIAFERLAAEPELAASSQHAGLYQALFSFQDARDRKRQWGALAHEQIAIFQKGATEDLGLWLMEVHDGLLGGFTYNADIYAAETARMLRLRYLELLARLADHPQATLAQLLDDTASEPGRYLRQRRADAQATANAALTAAPTAPEPAPQATMAISVTEAELVQLWKSLLGLPEVGVHDNFFNIGGNSLRAMQLIANIEARLAKRVKPAVLLEAPTIRQLATVLDQMAGRNSLVRLRSGEGRPAVFFIHDADGAILLYRNVAMRLHPGHAVYGLQPHVDEQEVVQHTRMADMVAHYVAKIRSVQPHGPYILGGLCAGGTIAFEVARQLQTQGETIAALALFDAADIAAPWKPGLLMRKRVQRATALFQPGAGGDKPSALAAIPGLLRKIKGFVAYKISSTLGRATLRVQVRLLGWYLDRRATPPRSLRELSVREILSCSEQALAGTGPLQGDVLLFRATQNLTGEGDDPFVERYQDPLFGWPARIQGRVRLFEMAGGHSSMLQEPQADALARQLQACVDEAMGLSP